MSQASSSLDELLRLVAALPEREMRREAVRTWMRREPAADVAEQLDTLVGRCVRREPDALGALLAFADLLLHLDETDSLVLEALDIESGRAERTAALMLLADFPPRRVIDPLQRRNMQVKKHVPLGVRRAQARQSRRANLEVLFSDPDAVVVSILCANPRVREEDIVAVAARRPNWPDILDAVARSRWLPSEAIQQALIQNPYARTSLGLSLLPLMNRPFLRAVRFARDLHRSIPAAAEMLLGLGGERAQGG